MHYSVVTGEVEFTDATASDDWKPEWVKLIFKDGAHLTCPLNRWMDNNGGYFSMVKARYPRKLKFECFTSDKGMYILFVSFHKSNFANEHN